MSKSATEPTVSRTVVPTTQYSKDYKRESKGQYRTILEKELVEVLQLLINDQLLPERNKDHPLAGEWKGYRDCHIKPDLVLIYQKPDKELKLVRLGSHSELGI
jgi:mRNA interferase YafQ